MRNRQITPVNKTNGLTLSTEPVEWGTVSRPSPHFHGTPTPPVLHRATCRYFRGADERSADVEQTCSPRDLYNGVVHIAFDRACKTCSRDMQ
jgi:hypothetical protein